MSNLVPPSQIEQIVGVARHPTQHWGRAVSADQQVYVLHSQACLGSGRDLRSCRFSIVLDQGIGVLTWLGFEDRPVRLLIGSGTPPRLVPAR